eukprot:GHRR01019898.1.p1 GENE.GHRR01019898.1~~GHRR01019898.1.p1  ORF type:complete len:149 (+),score=45.70 GHRR01019898.1:647-1093(+)
MRVVVPFADSAFVATSTSSNGTIAATAAPSPVVVQHGPVTASQSATAAATVQMQKRKERTAAGTPYKAPGGNWSKFKQYSVWQVSWCSTPGLPCTVFVAFTVLKIRVFLITLMPLQDNNSLQHFAHWLAIFSTIATCTWFGRVVSWQL